MLQTDFERIQSKQNSYKYLSLEYIDYSDIPEYQIILENENTILLFGYNNEAKSYEYHWAANHPAELLKAMDQELSCLITFIPDEWVEVFKNSGFLVRNAWHDYFMDSLEHIPEGEGVESLKEEESEEASLVTLACRGQSRGFTGQTTEWIREWVDNSEEVMEETGIRNKVIFIERNDKGELVGIVCTGTYGHESEKGAVVWIREVAVKPEYQRKGIARKLINQALAYGKEHGAKRAFLAADECNTYAIHLYESIGFRAADGKSQIDMIRE